MYTGTLITDLLAMAERARKRLSDRADDEAAASESEELPQALGLSAAHRDLGLFLVVHPQLVRALEPRHNLADPINVNQVRAVGSPKHIRVEAVEQLLQCPAVRLSFHPGCTRSHNCDHAVFDPRIADIFLVHEKHTTGSPQQDF